jgi:hypothetical protein
MYGNTPFGGADESVTLTTEQRQSLRRDLSRVAARTRELLPDEFVVGAEITTQHDGPTATVAVQPPVGPVVSAGYTPENADDDIAIDADECTDLAQGLAASAALQVKQSIDDDASPAAR